MSKWAYLTLCIFLGISLIACSVINLSNQYSTSQNNFNNSTSESTTSNNTNLKDDLFNKEEINLLEKLRIHDNGTKTIIIENPPTKTYDVLISKTFNDTQEYTDSHGIIRTDVFGNKVAIITNEINFFCGFAGSLYFLDVPLGNNKMPLGDEQSRQKGYKLNKVVIQYINNEDRTKIADCTIFGINWENIKFNVYRNYTAPWMGVPIGCLDRNCSNK